MQAVDKHNQDMPQAPPAEAEHEPEQDKPRTPTDNAGADTSVDTDADATAGPDLETVAIDTDGDMGNDQALPSPPLPAPPSKGSEPAAAAHAAKGSVVGRVAARLLRAWKTGARNRGAFSGTGMVLVLKGAFLLWLYIGTETGYGSLISSFATEKEFMGEKSAALLTSVYWGCMLIGRMVGVFASLKFTPRQIIISDLIGALVFTSLLFVFSGSESMLWVCSGGLGLSVGSLYASVMAWLDEVLEVSGLIISIIVIWVCISEALLPMFLALLMEVGTDNFIYFSLSMMAGCCGVFAAMDWYRNKHTAV
jgi:hypothetical protein